MTGRLTNGWQGVSLDCSWTRHLGVEFGQHYMQELLSFLQQRPSEFYPADDNNIFAALNATPLNTVRVVIIGQDPYYEQGQADGLSFSVAPGIQRPRSLKNIFKEINDDELLQLSLLIDLRSRYWRG